MTTMAMSYINNNEHDYLENPSEIQATRALEALSPNNSCLVLHDLGNSSLIVYCDTTQSRYIVSLEGKNRVLYAQDEKLEGEDVDRIIEYHALDADKHRTRMKYSVEKELAFSIALYFLKTGKIPSEVKMTDLL